jgi:hypothetical protein
MEPEMRNLAMNQDQAPPLPAGYAAAERLATDMLSAAGQGDWETVVALRRAIPGMARSMEQHWSAIRSHDPAQARRLEKERLLAIRRILAVDDQIRRLSDPWRGPLDGWLRGAAAGRTLN